MNSNTYRNNIFSLYHSLIFCQRFVQDTTYFFVVDKYQEFLITFIYCHTTIICNIIDIFLIWCLLYILFFIINHTQNDSKFFQCFIIIVQHSHQFTNILSFYYIILELQIASIAYRKLTYWWIVSLVNENRKLFRLLSR